MRKVALLWVGELFPTLARAPYSIFEEHFRSPLYMFANLIRDMSVETWFSDSCLQLCTFVRASQALTNHTRGVKTTTVGSSLLSPQVSLLRPAHCHSHTQLNLIWFIPVF